MDAYGQFGRPLVTAQHFPPGTTQWFLAPALSPDAERVIYSRIENKSTGRLWISSVHGGNPIPLTNEAALVEQAGSWSPDGGWFVYVAVKNGRLDLMKVRTVGEAAPSILKGGVICCLIPSWSPAGDWIAHGQELISPDGKTTRPLGNRGSPYYMFSADGNSFMA